MASLERSKAATAGENMITNAIGKRTVVSLLKPFADFADPSRNAPRDMIITHGSPVVNGYLTMGHCYDAADAIALIEAIIAMDTP